MVADAKGWIDTVADSFGAGSSSEESENVRTGIFLRAGDRDFFRRRRLYSGDSDTSNKKEYKSH